jgi:hypothetical protein
VVGAYAYALAAVYTALLEDDRFLVANTYGFRVAAFDTGRAAFAEIAVRA